MLVLFILLIVAVSLTILFVSNRKSAEKSTVTFKAPSFATNIGIVDQVQSEMNLDGYRRFINVPAAKFDEVAEPGLIGVLANPSDFKFLGQEYKKWGQWCYFSRDITEIHLKEYQLVAKPDTSINNPEFLQFCQDQTKPVEVYRIVATVDGDITITVTKVNMPIVVKFE